MRTIYVPALLTGIENPIRRCLIPGNKFGLYKGYDPSWFTDLALFLHEECLVSYFYSGKFSEYRKTMRMRNDINLWADSGGYSVLTQGAQIDVKKVIKWQEHNSNVAFSLDVPPATSENVGRVYPGKIRYHGKDKFEECAEISRKNNFAFQDVRTSDKLMIYNVIHGYNRSTLNLWWDYVATDTIFEGYATGAKPTSNTLLQALCLTFLYDKGVRKNVHLLGVSGVTVLPVLVWMSQYIDRISFDSTSYGYGSRTRAYMYPDKIRDYTHFGKKYKTKVKPLTKLTCSCPVCQLVKTIDYFCESGVTWPGLLLSLHNLWITKKYVETLEHTLDRSKEEFFKVVKHHSGNYYNDAVHAINFIEKCVHEGFDQTYDKYFANSENEKPKFKQRSLL